MKILIASHSDRSGGAARAAYRLHRAMIKNAIDSEMIVKMKLTDDYTVRLGYKSKLRHLLSRVISVLSNKLMIFQKVHNPILHSFNLFGSAVYDAINDTEADLVNLHWINSETLSVKQIGKINKPIVMTLHDMWAFCGSEHLSIDNANSQFRLGYSKQTEASDYISGLNLNRLVWELKRKHWNKPFTLVTPSRWLSKCAKESVLFKGWEIHTIPNALDTDVFKPISKKFAREVLNLPQEKKLIGFGAFGGTNEPHKGFDLLNEALNKLPATSDYCCVVIGQSAPKDQSSLSALPFEFIGHISDDATLALYYNAIDVVVVPSRQENLPQMGTESHACGTPVVAFNTTGFVDVIEHKKTGYLASPFSTEDLAHGINWSIENGDKLSDNCRTRALTLWSFDVVAEKYKDLYERVCSWS